MHGSVDHWLHQEVHWLGVGDIMGGILRDMKVGAFAIECVGWRHRKTRAVQLCDHCHGLVAA